MPTASVKPDARGKAVPRSPACIAQADFTSLSDLATFMWRAEWLAFNVTMDCTSREPSIPCRLPTLLRHALDIATRLASTPDDPVWLAAEDA